MKMKLALAAVSGAFEAKCASPINPPPDSRLMVEGTGKIGFVRGEG